MPSIEDSSEAHLCQGATSLLPSSSTATPVNPIYPSRLLGNPIPTASSVWASSCSYAEADRLLASAHRVHVHDITSHLPTYLPTRFNSGWASTSLASTASEHYPTAMNSPRPELFFLSTVPLVHPSVPLCGYEFSETRAFLFLYCYFFFFTEHQCPFVRSSCVV